MNQSFLHKQLFWGIRVWQLMATAGFYIFFAFQYWFAIWYTGNDNILPEVSIDYFFLKPILTLPVWWLFFIKFRHKSILFKICLHIFTSIAWVFCWFHAYRFFQDLRNDGYLQGDGIWWDIYIPFLVYCIQFGIFHVYDYYLQNQKQKEKEKELMRAAYNSEVNALKAQIQPHFLFNTLNSISASVPREMEHTRELIAQLADTFRYSLKASEQEWISLEEELSFTKTTLALEKERLKDRLQIEYEIDQEVLQTKIPPMLLQPLTENAVKHGISPSVKGGTILISVKKSGKFVRIRICDTGEGTQLSNKELFARGIGLKNSNLRLEKHFNESILVGPNQPSGLCFSFQIPFDSKK